MKKAITVTVLILFHAGMAGCYLYNNPGKLIDLSYRAVELRSGFERKEVTSSGFTWSYLDGGNMKGETILLLHGFSSNKESWLRVATLLAHRYRVIIPDIPGFGKTRVIKEKKYFIRDQAGRIHTFLEDIGIPSIHVMGVSMGGWLSSRLTLEYPGMIKSAGLMSAAGLTTQQESDYLKRLRETGENVLTPDTPEELQNMLKWVMYQPPRFPGFILRHILAQRKARITTETFLFDYLAKSDTSWIEKHLPSSTKPFFIIHGRQDRIIHPSTAQKYHKLIPNSRLIMLDKTGHSPLHSRPKLVAHHYLAFLENWQVTSDVIRINK